MKSWASRVPGTTAWPGWLRYLAWTVLWLLSGAAVDRFICNGPESPAPVQSALALLFALLTCRGLLLTAEAAGLKGRGSGRRDWPCYVPVAGYALLWGRHNFLNFLYYDELSHFTLLPVPAGRLLKTFLHPVNDHLMPGAGAYWYLISSLFRGDYTGVAAGAFVCAVVCVVGAYLLIRLTFPGDPRGLPLVVATLLAATPHSPHVILWKGAGDSLLLTLAFFFPTLGVLACVLAGRLAPDGRALAVAVAGMVLTVFSSSLVTVLPVYLVPFGLWLYLEPGEKRGRTRFFTAAFVAAVAVTLLYWGVRRYVALVDFPQTAWSWERVLGSLRGVLEVYFRVPALTRLFLAGSAAAAAWLLVALFDRAWRHDRRGLVRTDRSAVAWALGFLMFVVGTLQLTAARRMTYEARWAMAGYHLFLPNWGLGLACVGLVGLAANGLAGLAARAPRLVLPRRAVWAVRAAALAVAFAGASVYGVWQGVRLNKAWPVLTTYPLEGSVYYPAVLPPAGVTKITVIRARAEFATDLRRFVECAARNAPRNGRGLVVLPDLCLADSPRFGAMAWWPLFINNNPQYSVNWTPLSRLSFHLRLARLDSWLGEASGVRFVRPDKVPPGTLQGLLSDPETGRFLHKYWPDLGTEPSSPATLPEPRSAS